MTPLQVTSSQVTKLLGTTAAGFILGVGFSLALDYIFPVPSYTLTRCDMSKTLIQEVVYETHSICVYKHYFK